MFTKLFIFDVRTFTVLTLSDTPSPLLTVLIQVVLDLQVTHQVDVLGLVFDTDTSGNLGHRVRLTNVVGTFQSGEKLIIRFDIEQVDL